MSRFYHRKRLIWYLVLILIAVLVIYLIGEEDNGWLKNKIRYLIRSLT